MGLIYDTGDGVRRDREWGDIEDDEEDCAADNNDDSAAAAARARPGVKGDGGDGGHAITPTVFVDVFGNRPRSLGLSRVVTKLELPLRSRSTTRPQRFSLPP